MSPDSIPSEDRNRRVLLGGKEIPLGRTLNTGDPYAKGIRPICPECGELWGKVEFGGRRHPGRGSEYLIARWPCLAHGTPWQTGGSLWKLLTWWDRGLPPALGAALPYFSPELCAREALLRAYQILGEIPPSDERQRESDASGD